MRTKATEAKNAPAGIALWFEFSAFFLLIFLAALRPMVGETFESGGDTFSRAIPEIRDPLPARTVAFDLIVLFSAVLTLAASAIHRRAFRTTGLLPGLLLVVIAAGISTVVAGNQRLAINASLDWMCLPIASVVLIQVTRRRWQQRVLLGAVLATAAVQAFQCYDRYTMLDETWAGYQSRRGEFWASQGVDPDSGTVALFEQRMKSGEVGGFFAHTNVAASYLVMCGLASLGLTLALWPSDDPRNGVRHGRGAGPLDRVEVSERRSDSSRNFTVVALTAAATAFIFSALTLTGSLGGWLSAAVAMVFYVVAWGFRGSIARMPRAAWIFGWAAVIVGCMAGVGYGLYFDRLPGASLTFRWEYWKASADMVFDYPWTGVGRENFGRHYVQYKPIHSPEEVANPHNLLVQVAAEWGVLGLLGVMVMVIGGSITAGRSLIDGISNVRADSLAMHATRERLIVGLCGAGLLAGLVVVRPFLMDADDPNLIYWTSVTGGLTWSAAYCVLALPAWSRSAPVLRIGVAAALISFLIHELINFAAFVPASGYTFFVLFAGLVAMRGDLQLSSGVIGLPKGTDVVRWSLTAVAAAVTVLVAVMIYRPVAATGWHLTDARELARSGQPVAAVERLQIAIATDALDPIPPAETARLQAELVVGSAGARDVSRTEILFDSAKNLTTAIRRDPFNVSLQRGLAQIRLQYASATGDDEAYLAAVEAAQRILRLYPQSPLDLVRVAEIELAAAEAISDAGVRAELAQAAEDHFQSAVDLDKQRPAWERHRRLSARELRDIESGLTRAKAADR